MPVFTNPKQLLARALCHPTVGSVISAVFQRRIPAQGGLCVDINNDYVSPDNAARIYWGLYERNEIRHLHKFLRSDLDVVEFGSGIGVISMHIIRIQERSRRLICVEANPHLIETIKINVGLNFPWKRVEILNRALDYSGQAKVNLSVCTNNLGSGIRGGNDGHLVPVRATTLKEILADYDVKEFALVADAEGAEAGMIVQDGAALARCCQIIIELHTGVYAGQVYHVEDLCERIESMHGFRLVTRRHGVHVFEKC